MKKQFLIFSLLSPSFYPNYERFNCYERRKIKINKNYIKNIKLNYHFLPATLTYASGAKNK